MKAVISNRIYLDINPEDYLALDKALTYKIPSYRRDMPDTIIKQARKIRDKIVSIPVGRTDLIPKGYEIKDKRVDNPVVFPEVDFISMLRDSQRVVYEGVDDNCVINAFVSWGKTFTALAIAHKLKQKTLVITHTVALRNQWEKEIKRLFGFKAGLIGSGVFDLESPIVVGNIQTLYKRRGQIEKEFGLVIVDECHHIPANTFSRLVDASYARYKIGLSGTVERKDGRHVLMPDYFGHKKYAPPRENYMMPSVDVIRSQIRFQDGARVPWANRVNDLVRQEEYGKLVSFLAASYRSKGHKVLLLSDRVYFLKRIKETLGEHCELITGEVSQADREGMIQRVQSGKVDILLGTQSIFSEGISVNPLSCLILATPVNNSPLLTQLIGRVVRMYPNKVQPKIVDINLIGKTAEKQAKIRLGHYMGENYKINFIDM